MEVALTVAPNFAIDSISDESLDGQVCLKLPEMSHDEFPTVSILTPTGNRPHFVSLMFRNWNAIDYPKDKLEWIIVDDGESPMLPGKPTDPRIKYVFTSKRNTLGKKRNFAACLASGEYLVHMDDDDFYPAESVVARIKVLLVYKKDCVGCNKTLCYDLLRDQTFEAFDAGPDGKPCTISESTLAYSKKFFKEKQFRNEDTQAECLEFIRDRYDRVITIPYVFVVTQLTHGKNTIRRFVTQTTHHTTQFLKRVSFKDQQLLISIRAAIIAEIPQWKQAISAVQKWMNAQAKGELDVRRLNRSISELPEELWTNPMILNFRRGYQQKNSSTGRDLVWYCGPGQYFQFTNKWNGRSGDVGGSEESVINMAKGLAKRKWNVAVYCVTDAKRIVDGVWYIPYWEWLPLDRQDVTIIWRDPSILQDQRVNSGKIILDLHDVIDPKWITKEISEQLTYICVKSKFHASTVNSEIGAPFARSANIIKIIPNGIHVADFACSGEEKKSNIIINTSSPDRSLRALLRALPVIRREIPNAEIHWAYGFRNGIQEGGMEADSRKYVTDWVAETKEIMANTEGFVDLGRLSQTDICGLYRKAKVFAYGTRFPEIDCISMTKALAAGCIPVVTNTAALGEKIENCNSIAFDAQRRPASDNEIDYSIEPGEIFDEWVRGIISALSTPEGVEGYGFAVSTPEGVEGYGFAVSTPEGAEGYGFAVSTPVDRNEASTRCDIRKYDYEVVLDSFVNLIHN
jgi:glycosyltransferase involved in cell wall biosynthesis